jgi:hypothetical protein
MRQSNAEPLTLAAWQYQLLMEWVAQLEAAPAPMAAVAEAAASAPLSDQAVQRRSAVLARLKAGQGGQG